MRDAACSPGQIASAAVVCQISPRAHDGLSSLLILHRSNLNIEGQRLNVSQGARMTTPFPALTTAGRGARFPWLAAAATVVAALFVTNVSAQAPAAAGNAAPALSTEALDKLVGRIALYPDDLVAIILPASTNPLQVVQADRFLEKRKADPKLPIDEKWDDSVKALVNYPEVVKMMSGDLDWTAALGEAVVADQGAVLEAIQAFRRKTEAAGNLKSDDKQVVVVEKEVIKIVPANPEVIYVPQYNPTTVIVVGGYSSWGYWPTPYPVYYYPYPPGAAFATGLIWGAAIGASWHGGRYATHYGHGGYSNINIDRSTNININSGNINSGNVNRPGGPGQSPGGGGTAWKPDKKPGQVTSGGGATSRPSVGYAPAGGGGAGAGSAAAGRPSTLPSGNVSGGAGTAQTRPSNPGGGAFNSGSASGRETQLNSSRGASSRASAPSGGARAAPRGGGGRGRR
jgi:hypothetical protein